MYKYIKYLQKNSENLLQFGGEKCKFSANCNSDKIDNPRHYSLFLHPDGCVKCKGKIRCDTCGNGILCKFDVNCDPKKVERNHYQKYKHPFGCSSCNGANICGICNYGNCFQESKSGCSFCKISEFGGYPQSPMRFCLFNKLDKYFGVTAFLAIQDDRFKEKNSGLYFLIIPNGHIDTTPDINGNSFSRMLQNTSCYGKLREYLEYTYNMAFFIAKYLVKDNRHTLGTIDELKVDIS